MNIDIGSQRNSGRDASRVSDIANGTPCAAPNPPPYVLLQKEHTHSTSVRTDESGNLWVIVGTDSGYEGRTTLYYKRVTVTFIED